MRWGYLFIDIGNYLTFEERMEVARKTVRTYLDGVNNADIKGSAYEGRITITERHFCMGGFVGRKAEIEIDANPVGGQERGRTTISMLLTEKINQNLN